MTKDNRDDTLKAIGISLAITVLLEGVIAFFMEGIGNLFGILLFFPIYFVTRKKIASKRNQTSP